MPSVKKNLLIDIPSQSGVTYDGQEVVFSKKDVTLKCWMRCRNVENMWRNLNALVYDLIKRTKRLMMKDMSMKMRNGISISGSL